MPHVWAVIDEPSTASGDDCEDEEEVCALCYHKCTITVVGSAMRNVVLDVLTLTLVGMKLCMLHHNSPILLYLYELPIFYNTPYYIVSLEHNPRVGVTVVE